MNEYRAAEAFYLNRLKEVKDDSPDIPIIHATLGYISYEKKNISMAILQERLNISYLEERNKSLLEMLCSNITNIFIEDNNYERALRYFW